MIIDDLFEAPQSCPHCGGPMFSEMLMMEKKDACYYKVKASAKVWPSAYASGRLVQCRKKGADNYGNKSEGVMEMDKSQTPPGRDGSNDSDAGKKEYTATPTTPGAVARQGSDILNKAFIDSQRVDPRTGKKMNTKGVAEEYELAGVGVAYELGRRAYKQGMTIRDNPYSATREARKNDEWAKGLERGKHDANDARHFRSSVREQAVAEGTLEPGVNHRGDVDRNADIEVLGVDYNTKTWKITYNGKPYTVKADYFSREDLSRWQIPDYDVEIINRNGKNIMNMIDWDNEGSSKTDRQIKMVNTIIAYLDTENAQDIQYMAWKDQELDNVTAHEFYNDIRNFYNKDQQKIDQTVQWLLKNMTDDEAREGLADYIKNPVNPLDWNTKENLKNNRTYIMYVAFSYSREGNTEMTPGMNLPKIQLNDPDDEDELQQQLDALFKKVEFKFDAFENKIVELGDKFGFNPPDLGSGMGAREMFWELTMQTAWPKEYKYTQKAATDILNFKAAVDKYAKSFNSSLIKIGLPGISEYAIWYGVLSDDLTQQQADYFATPEGFANVANGKINVSKMINDNMQRKSLGEKLGDNRPKLGSKRDAGKSIRKWRKTRGLDETDVAETMATFSAKASTRNSGSGEFRGVSIPSDMKHPEWREPTWSFQEIAQKLGIPVATLNLLAFNRIGGFPEALSGLSARHGSKKYYKQSEVKRWVNANNVREKLKQGVAEGISLDALGKVANIIPSFAQKLGIAAKQEVQETRDMLNILKLKMQGKPVTPEQIKFMNKQWKDLAIIALGVGTIGYATAAAGAAHGAAAAVSHGAKDALIHGIADIGLEAAAEVLAAKFGINIVKNLTHSLATSTGQEYEHGQEQAPAQYGVSPAVAAQNQANLEKKFQQAKMGFGGMSENQVNEKSVSQAQFRTMAAAAHNPEFAKKVGISQDVAQEFHSADKNSNYKKLPDRTTEGSLKETDTSRRGFLRGLAAFAASAAVPAPVVKLLSTPAGIAAMPIPAGIALLKGIQEHLDQWDPEDDDDYYEAWEDMAGELGFEDEDAGDEYGESAQDQLADIVNLYRENPELAAAQLIKHLQTNLGVSAKEINPSFASRADNPNDWRYHDKQQGATGTSKKDAELANLTRLAAAAQSAANARLQQSAAAATVKHMGPVQYAKDIPALPAPTKPEFDLAPNLKQKEKVPVSQQYKKDNQQGMDEGEQQKGADYRDPPEADYGDDYQAMVARMKKLAGLGPLKTVYDPQKRVYRNMPTAVQPKK